MDEAEKYQQRLQAITEKRRLQEEQERAKREMEEERLRLQQLKRKSLRDQWLMDGPSSPTSSEPRSPLWGSQAQEMEQHIDNVFVGGQPHLIVYTVAV
uniref:paralemmin-3-like n=1 Tax=Oncorhynchus gorbuscha TaxID=8017 RepID=UPI001EAF468D|nr:paralemmin-3-like [Oncorhynchus gorbuscha]